MARIRTIKPEAFESEDLASVSVTAERTFFGLLTQADDAGRFRDNAAIIAGRLWALRPDHTAAHVARDLEQLADAGLICRYTGCDGRAWLHIVTWERHQKISKATPSRAPRCPRHGDGGPCGRCQSAQCPASASSASPAPPGGLREEAGNASVPSGGNDSAPIPGAPATVDGEAVPDRAMPGPVVTSRGKPADHARGPEGSGRTPGGFPEPSGSGSRIMDPGSPLGGRKAPALPGAPVTAKELVAEYVAGCARRPPQDFLGLLGRKVKALLEESFVPEDIRSALDRLRNKGLHPSVLPSLVNEIVNTPPSSVSGAGPWASNASTYTPYLDATAPEPTGFGGRL
ncbi:hypothetical protein [Streptomyces albus]|uniref:hypothetical protein n=1 Tax=Streptomyces albus TaxID=1888 RepID=UPI003F1BF136